LFGCDLQRDNVNVIVIGPGNLLSLEDLCPITIEKIGKITRKKIQFLRIEPGFLTRHLETKSMNCELHLSGSLKEGGGLEGIMKMARIG
jgi:hypothetical protein